MGNEFSAQNVPYVPQAVMDTSINDRPLVTPLIELDRDDAFGKCESQNLFRFIDTDDTGIAGPKSFKLDTKKLPKGTLESDYRIQNAGSLQQKRWDWIQSMPTEYLIALQQTPGILPDDVVDLIKGNRPLGFSSNLQYNQFTSELKEAFQKISRETTLTGFRVIQQGSWVTGYSSNPRKGQRVVPSHLFNENSDLDFRITAKGIEKYVGQLKDPIKYKQYYENIIEPDQLIKVFPELDAFSSHWTQKLGRDIQISIVVPPVENFDPKPWDQELCFQ